MDHYQLGDLLSFTAGVNPTRIAMIRLRLSRTCIKSRLR